jgi:predicted permease
MRTLRALIMRVCGIFGATRTDRDIAEELQSHFDMIVAEKHRAGLSEQEARRAAAAVFGSFGGAADAYRDRRGLPSLESWARDFIYAARSLARTRAATLSIVLILALGIGICTAIVSMFHALTWRTLRVPEGDRVVKLALNLHGEVDREVNGPVSGFSYPEITTIRRGAQALEIAGLRNDSAIWREQGEPRRLSAALVTGPYFALLRVRPAAGRLFGDADARRPVAVISDRLWSTAFRRDPEAIARPMILDGASYTIVGVMERAFTGTDVESPDVWLPLEIAIAQRGDKERLAEPNLSWLQAIGRLADGQSIEAARAEAAVMAARLRFTNPNMRATITVVQAARVDPGALRAKGSAIVAVTFGIILLLTLLILICCSNAAGLLLARGVARQKEIAVRIALGAGRGRIVQQLVAEHLLISAVAAVLGVALAVWALRAVAPLLPMEDVFQAFRPDLPVLAFAILFAVLTAVLVGVAPARQALAVDPLPALKGAESGRRRMPAARLRHALVSFQVALSVILIACSAVLARGIVRALRVDPGFPLQGLYAVMLETSVSEPRAQLPLQRVREILRGTPGVGNVGLTSIPPFHGAGFSFARTDLMASPVPVNFSIVDVDYFRTLGVAPNAGRSFDAAETRTSVLVNSSFARRFWGDEREAVGRSFEFPDRRDEQASESVTVVGVVPTIQSIDVGVPDGPTFYLMSEATTNGRLSLVVRAEPHVPILRIAADAARSLDADAVATVVSIQERIAARTMPARVSATVAAAIGLLAVLVALVGIHGIVAHAVSSRTREIGVHVALGASRARILQLIMGDSLRCVLKGGIAGGLVVLVGAYALSAVLRPLTLGVAALDPIALLATALLLSVLTFPAAYLPARRALGIAPIEALRNDA